MTIIGEVSFKGFNGDVKISEHIKDCSNLFRGCYEFNQPVTIPGNVKLCDKMFFGCTSFNQMIEIPVDVKSCNDMFYGCYSMTSEVICTYSQYLTSGLVTLGYYWDNGVARYAMAS